MTNYQAVTRNPPTSRGSNIKEGQCPNRYPGHNAQEATDQQFLALGFIRVDWNKWSYTWAPDGQFPIFTLAPGIVELAVGLVATCVCVEPPVQILFQYGRPPSEIKERLDNEILAIMRRAAHLIESDIEWVELDAPIPFMGEPIGGATC